MTDEVEEVDVRYTHGLVIEDQDGRCSFVSPLMTRAEAETLQATLAGGRVIEADELRRIRATLFDRR